MTSVLPLRPLVARAVAAGALTGILTFILAKPAAADNCDIFINALDCQNTGWTIGIIATAGGAAAAAVAAASKGKPKVTEKKKKTKTCKEASDWLSSGAETGEADSRFTPNVGKPTRGKTDAGSHTLSVDVTWTQDVASSSTTLEVPEWPNMSDAERAAVKDYRDNLKAHEDGHHEVANDFMAKSGKKITGEGNTPEEARTDLQRKLDEYKTETHEKLEEATKAYDDKTDHGRNQSAVGGKNVTLNCSPGVS